MEPQQQQQVGNINIEDPQGGGVNGKGSSSSSFLCRQSSTRWTPTTDQIRILKDLYYNNGVRSPTAEQIQRISAKLRQYGKIEGKNVFYWFQNHKARERQKKRFTADHHHHHHQMNMNMNMNMNVNVNVPAGPMLNNNNNNNNHYNKSPHVYNKFSNNVNNCHVPAGGSFPSSSMTHGPVGNYGYGSVAMEKSFRECSITSSADANVAWIGINNHEYHHHPYPNYFDTRKYINGHDQTLEIEEETQENTTEIETLPLFPMHADIKQGTSDYFNGCLDNAGCPRASLELTLNSWFGNSKNY